MGTRSNNETVNQSTENENGVWGMENVREYGK
jgi:hypothetical protein